ncbi:MAG: aminoacyl-histidine dipeptidase [Muribaculaceae bacterium]|nr:aminoacyl-histidine dipeptidase [Muribaculaceae bacterium]
MEVKDLKPALIWQCFDEITKVPRPSCHEEQIREYLLDFAKKNNIEAKTDDCGNVVMTKAATAGCENAPTVILQAHMDMVAEKNNDVEHDFLKDPIQTYIDGEWVKAKGTTLGADNGIGMAGALAVLLDNTLEHGKVECLFTINEEIGLEGAQNLGKDMITGSMLINLDSEDDGEIFVGCAGGIDTTAYFNYTPIAAPEDLCYVKVAISGLLGGHSGSDINTGRGNANKLIARFVWNISKDIELKLASFDGGNLRNAIPREAHAILGVAADKKAEIEARLAEYTKEIENEYKGIEPVVKFTLEAVERPAFIVDDATAKALILSLYSAPHGVYSMSRDLEGLVETSTNLAAVKFIDGNKIKVTTSQRSSVESRKHDIAAQVETHFLLAGAEIDHSDGYPGWAPNMDSTIMRVCSEAYEELYNVKPAIKAIHAGLECGLFLAKYPHLDMVSVGPTMTGVHSPDEKLYIPHVEKFWHHLALTLKKVAKL